jgi:hypothetical protein
VSLSRKTTIAISTVLTKTSHRLAYVLHKTPNVFPIIGGRKKSHLEGNIAALSLKLSSEDIEKIDGAYSFDIGFPLNFLFMGQKTPSRKGEDVFLTRLAANIQTVERPQPIVAYDL